MRRVIAAGVSTLLIAGCTGRTASHFAQPRLEPAYASATIINASGASIGQATFHRSPRGGVLIRVRAAGLAPGEHGIHIHQNGACDAPAFTSAGPHLRREGSTNPHGLLHPSGGEAGDLPNLVVNADGAAEAEITSAGVVETPQGAAPGVVGRAIVIHAAPDDQKTQPIGGSGDRIACGVITSTR